MSLTSYADLGRASEVVSRAIRHGAVSHAYIIEGDHTTDKFGFAVAFAKALLCAEAPGEGCDQCLTCRKIDSGNYEDLYVLRPEASRAGGTLSLRDQAAEALQERLRLKPTGGDRNIAIVEGADLMTARAQNRFLKTLEEPADGTVILLLSENTENLLPTIRSRCIVLRVGASGASGTSEMGECAEEILGMVSRRAFFFDIQKTLEKQVKDRQSANAFLDALERALSQAMRDGGTSFSRGAIAEAISLVEHARMDIRRNVNQKYAIRSLILKLEEF